MRLLAAFSMLCTVIASSVSVKDCAPGSPFRISEVDFSPANPVAGQNGTLHTVYDVPAEVTGGSARYTCSLNGLPVYDETLDLCSQTTCPIVAGTHDDHSISAVPSTSGKVSCKINWSNTAGSQLMCVQMTLVLDAPSLRGSNIGAAVYAPPLLFHNHVLGHTTIGMCNVSSYDESLSPYSEIEEDDNSSTEDNSSSSSSSVDDKMKRVVLYFRSS